MAISSLQLLLQWNRCLHYHPWGCFNKLFFLLCDYYRGIKQKKFGSQSVTYPENPPNKTYPCCSSEGIVLSTLRCFLGIFFGHSNNIKDLLNHYYCIKDIKYNNYFEYPLVYIIHHCNEGQLPRVSLKSSPDIKEILLCFKSNHK